MMEMNSDKTMNSDLGRLRNFIHQGKIRKLRNFLKNHSDGLAEIFNQEFDACAYATKFRQDNLLPLLHSYGFPLDGYPKTRSITALIIAIRRCDLNCVESLIELGCDVNCSVRSFTMIPLLEAYQTYRNKRDNFFLSERAKTIILKLLKSGASPNVYNIHSMRLVHLAMVDGEFELLKLFISHGADVNAMTQHHRRNLLHFICDRARNEDADNNLLGMARFLIKLGCNVNHRDDCFETPLMCTLHHGGNLTLAHELIVEGTELDLKNNFGNTYLTRAVHYALYDHARMALYAGAPCRAWQCSFPYMNRNYHQDASTSNETTLMDAIVDYQNFMTEFEFYLIQPRKLKDIARLSLRKRLPAPMSKSSKELVGFLPSSLIDYIMLKDMKTALNFDF